MKLQKLSPILWTKDLKQTISFYETVLGFKGKSNFPNFVTPTRENVEIMFVVVKWSAILGDDKYMKNVPR